MPQARKLVMGVDCPSPTKKEEENRIAALRLTVKKYLPKFVEAVNKVLEQKEETTVLMHQDAFAAGYDNDEYTILGMAIKYAGLHGVPVSITGRNHETF